MKEEPSSCVQSAQVQALATDKKHEDRDATGDQPAEDDDSLDEGILDEGGQMMPMDDLASPEDSYFLGFEYTDEQTDKMVLSPPQTTTEGVYLCKASCRHQTSTPTSNTCHDGASCTAGKGKTQLPGDA